jgi:DNA-binding NarL/FixJ family response regulator
MTTQTRSIVEVARAKDSYDLAKLTRETLQREYGTPGARHKADIVLAEAAGLLRTEVIELHRRGWTLKDIAHESGWSIGTVHRVVTACGDR